MAHNSTIILAGTKLLNESTEQVTGVIQAASRNSDSLELRQACSKLAFREYHFLSRLRSALENFEVEQSEHSKHQLLEIMSDVQFNTKTMHELRGYTREWERFERFVSEHLKSQGYYEVEIDIGLSLCKAMQMFIHRQTILTQKSLGSVESLIQSISYPAVMAALKASQYSHPIAYSNISQTLIKFSQNPSEARTATKANQIPKSLKSSLTYSQRQMQAYYDLFVREGPDEKK